MESNPRPQDRDSTGLVWLAYQSGYSFQCVRLSEKRTILMKSRNSYLGSFLVFRVILVIYVTDNRSRSLLGTCTTKPLLSMTPHIYIRPETDYDLPSSPLVNNQIKYGACCLTTARRLAITRMSLEPNKERQNS